MALIRFNAVMVLMLQWSKCTSLRMVEFKFTRPKFGTAQAFQLGFTGTEGSILGQASLLSEQVISMREKERTNRNN